MLARYRRRIKEFLIDGKDPDEVMGITGRIPAVHWALIEVRLSRPYRNQ